MICEICKKKQAKLHITQVKDDQKLTIHICHECAQENGISGPSINTSFSIEAHMTGSVQIKEPSAEPTRDENLHKTCSQCGLSYSAFKESGRLGCSMCYEVFAEQLKPLLQKVQKDFTHKGKTPRTESESLTLKRSISDLRLQLKDAVRQEQFELAAKLRDQIRGMEGELSNAPE